MIQKGKVPFDENGNAVWDPVYGKEYEWRENTHFNAYLEFVGHIKHASSFKFLFENHDKTRKYEVFTIDLEDFIRHSQNGKIAGTFKYICRGGYYGIKLVHASM